MHIFIKSRAHNSVVPGPKIKNKTPGVQLNFQGNIFVRFDNSRTNRNDWACYTTFWDGLTDIRTGANLK